MLELQHEYPKQHDYITSNLLWYEISIGLAFLGVLLSFVVPEAQRVSPAICSLWYLFVIIWTMCETSVVYDKTFAKDPEFKKTHNVIMAMYWLRASALIGIALLVCCTVCGLVLGK